MSAWVRLVVDADLNSYPARSDGSLSPETIDRIRDELEERFRRDFGTFDRLELVDLVDRNARCVFCGGSGWVDDKNWQPEHPAQRRVEHNGLLRCSCGVGSDNEGGPK